MDRDPSLDLHERLKGKIETRPRLKADTAEALSLVYTPGVASASLAIHENVNKSFELTRRWNVVAVVTDGTAVLGLGNVGPDAALPVMESKCLLFKSFGSVDAVPLCLRTRDVDEIVRVVEVLASNYGGINLEDISAPRCFEIERRLKALLNIPVFHDDQHGTAVVALAALANAARIVEKKLSTLKIVVAGAGAAGIAITRLLLDEGIFDLTLVDTRGAIHPGRADLNPIKKELCALTNPRRLEGSLANVLPGADVFIGVSAPNIVSRAMVASMARDAIVFACANPIPEISYEEARAAGARVVANGRSDCPNQLNNALAFPGIFRGTLDARARDIDEGMKRAAARALASFVKPHELTFEHILPRPFEPGVHEAVARAVLESARERGLARV